MIINKGFTCVIKQTIHNSNKTP